MAVIFLLLSCACALPCCTFSMVNHLIRTHSFTHTHTHTLSDMHISLCISAFSCALHTLNIYKNCFDIVSYNKYNECEFTRVYCTLKQILQPMPMVWVFCLPLNYQALLVCIRCMCSVLELVWCVVLFTQKYIHILKNIKYTK